MATDIVQGLFGMTPERYQLDQQAAAREQAMQFAQMDPFQRANYGIFLGGRQLGDAIGGALGAQDPMLQRISQQQSLLREINPSDATSLAAGIKKATEMGNPQLAMTLSDTLRALQKNQADVYKAQKEALSPEQKNAAALADSSGAIRGSEEWTKTYNTSLERLTTKKPNEALLKAQAIVEARAAVRNAPEGSTERAQAEDLLRALSMDKLQAIEVGTGPETVQKVLIDPFNPSAPPVPIGTPYSRFTSKTNVSVTQKGEEEFSKRLGGKDADRVDAAVTARDTAASAINSLNKLATLPADQLISGQFATGRVGATNLLTTLGLASPADAARLATSQQYQKVAGDVILQTLGGKLGSGFSNADREFIASLVPQLETNPEARRQLIMFMQNKNQEIIQESLRLENYARDKLSLKGYVPKIPLSVTPSAPNPYSGLSNEELAARIKAAQAAQGK